MAAMSKDELKKLDQKHFLHPTSNVKEQQENGPAIIFESGEGIYVKDIDGNQYIEGMSSLWNVNIGYGRKELGQIAKEQMDKLSFSSAFSTYSHEPAIRLSHKISQLTPGNLDTIFFTSGGSEANDSAIKLARHYWNIQGKPDKKKIISRKKAYHGVAMGSTSATGIPEFWKFAGSSKDFYHVDNLSAEELEALIKTENPESIAAFMAEPVIGAGGVIIPPENYFKKVKEICKKYNILFIADEVITGFGRTGKMFGMENWDVVPDLMTFAKGVSSGYLPLGGVVMTKEFHQVLSDKTEGTLFHGYTYSGHPVATAVALKNIEIIEEENLVENSLKMEKVMLEEFKKLESEIKYLGDGRSLGLLSAIEIYKDAKSKTRFEYKQAPLIVKEAAKLGLICRSVTYDEADSVVLAPPLIINENQIVEMIKILKQAIKNVI